MKNGRNAAITAAIACMLSAPLAIGPYAAGADELSDLRINQELLQRRLDQLAQAQVPGNPFGVGGPPGPTTVQTMGGSFPRSFLIPGTDTSIRVGGEIKTNILWWINGGNPQGNSSTTNGGTTGQLNNIPLDNSGAARAKGINVLNLSAQQSKVNFETRTPTAWGEARTFFEFDWAGDTAQSRRPLSGSNNLGARLRYAYGTLGGLLFGQANSNFSDSDAGMENLDFGGLIGHAGPSRIPQVRYTMPLAPWGLLGAWSVSAEAPETNFWAPAPFGAIGADPTMTNAVAGNPLKSSVPDFTSAWYIPQPWGHADFSAVIRPMLQVKDGMFVDRSYTGFAFNASGDVKPQWFGWTKDYIVWDSVYGKAAGRNVYAGSGNSDISLVSNYTTALAATAAGARSIIIKPVTSFAGETAYQHWWAPTVHSNIGIGIWHADINGLKGAVCPGGNSAAAKAARDTGAGGCGNNTELVSAIANVLWNPVPFVDIGLEYLWGHRFTVAKARGEENILESRFRVRF